eukprot:CAMPEP_0198725132 /NCGR_PEP_ID=MMETSP1475-20131203/2502_1 /TAXON_ID= ORGANISM="Unidentified sp., Strain CCMP1999" /NCGR_SAMPLE_ID=MMETSP1475 /ASSEMBLY_ACC=CAM_ASM_001111 /LENGTH=74 /DNA_ID=CAMNT_0044486843 /DNA_START=148 /DNA_END=369 /DNA_ORIENTATION=-
MKQKRTTDGLPLTSASAPHSCVCPCAHPCVCLASVLDHAALKLLESYLVPAAMAARVAAFQLVAPRCPGGLHRH